MVRLCQRGARSHGVDGRRSRANKWGPRRLGGANISREYSRPHLLAYHKIPKSKTHYYISSSSLSPSSPLIVLHHRLCSSNPEPFTSNLHFLQNHPAHSQFLLSLTKLAARSVDPCPTPQTISPSFSISRFNSRSSNAGGSVDSSMIALSRKTGNGITSRYIPCACERWIGVGERSEIMPVDMVKQGVRRTGRFTLKE